MGNLRQLILLLLLSLCVPLLATAHETVFATYFDIPVGSPAGTEVMGRIHLERNKDVLTRPIPRGYRFKITSQGGGKLFNVETQYDLSKRIMGVFKVAKGRTTGEIPSACHLTVALMDGKRLVEEFPVTINIVRKTLWQTFYERYLPVALANPRMYGNQKPDDGEVAAMLSELERNGWRFEGIKSYTARPQDYGGQVSALDHWQGGTIDYDWVKIANRIGGLGYAYATSKVYGPSGEPAKRKRLRHAICQAILAYTRTVPIEGRDMEIDGRPIGGCTGDGISLLSSYKLTGVQIATHQWLLTDPLVVPVLQLMPDLLRGMQGGDKTCIAVHDSLIRYLQLFTSIVRQRRDIDNPAGRWGEIQDTCYSSGAWADANLGHRSRTMLALPIIWADYNRPMTYVQYWYSDFYHDKPFRGFSFSPGWSPHGVVADVARWMTKCNVPARRYRQSGFQPDGTISHHIGHGTDAAMEAYGFELLTGCTTGYQYFKDTPFEIPGRCMQFQIDYLRNVYPKLFYKQSMDFLVSGRSFLDDQRAFVMKTYAHAVQNLSGTIGRQTRVTGLDSLQSTLASIMDNTYEHSGTQAYWVNEYLVHRRGTAEAPFFCSLKLKSERTVGAEDFDKVVRRSWFAGYGILPLKVTGNEYSQDVLRGFDWHALPGLTEEWRTDSLPLAGGAQASLPGMNKTAGVLADGVTGMGTYHHLPGETYSSATAFKTYHFLGDEIVALGSGVARRRAGQGSGIATFLDQSALDSPLTWCVGAKTRTVGVGESVDIAETIDGVCWLHQGRKGYVIVPDKRVQLLIKSGKKINITDTRKRSRNPGFIVAVNHGVVPGEEWDDGYCYVLLPNVSKDEMADKAEAVVRDLSFAKERGGAHAVYSDKCKTWQFAFFKPDTVSVGGVTVASGDVAQVMLRDCGDRWTLSVGNPAPDGKKKELVFRTSCSLRPGTYGYSVGGVSPTVGENVIVETEEGGSKVTVRLPDESDAAKYHYQAELYGAAPIVVNIRK